MKIVIAILVAIALFMGAKRLLCTPDHKVVDASLPLAKVIVEYVEKNGVPKYFSKIENLPYELKECTEKTEIISPNADDSTIENTEKCFFEHQGKKYFVKIESAGLKGKGFHVVYIEIKQHSTKCEYVIRLGVENDLWKHEHYPHPNMWKKSSLWICKPQPLRLTY